MAQVTTPLTSAALLLIFSVFSEKNSIFLKEFFVFLIPQIQVPCGFHKILLSFPPYFIREKIVFLLRGFSAFFTQNHSNLLPLSEGVRPKHTFFAHK